MSLAILRAGNTRVAPVVCVHPVSGRAADYQLLADALDWPGPVLGFSAPEPGRDAGEPGYRLTELASQYCDQLDLGVPQRLLGWSIGGVIAAELSRIVVARGGAVTFLGVLDSRAPQPEMRKRPTDRDTLARSFLHQLALTRELTPVPPPASTAPADLLAALRTLGAADELCDEAEVERRLQIFMGLIRAFFHHVQRPLPVPLHLFESTDAHPSHPKPPTLGWDELAPRLDRHAVAGTHFSLLAPHRIEALARTISRCLPP
jgi:thioesterase domain-containing protein